MWSEPTLRLIDLALDEDLGERGDVTARLLPNPDEPVRGRIVARRAGVAAGAALLPALLGAASRRLRGDLRLDGPTVEDGSLLATGECLAQIAGPLAALLSAERTLLNFLSRLCGVATLTRRFVEAARRGSPAVHVLDTRKTIPGWRELDKYAVRCGGGTNHRAGLYDAALLKDNHLAGVPLERFADHLRGLLARLDRRGLAFVEVEVDSLDQLSAALAVEAIDVILLDNFTPAGLRTATALRDAAGVQTRVALEASGGVTLEAIAEIAATGVERISVGALTHSAVGLDLGLDR